MKNRTHASRTIAASDEHVVLIAGDLTGSARAAAFAYARNGNHIVLVGNDDLAGLELTNTLLARHVDAEFVHADTNEASEVQDVVAQTIAHYGHLDVQYLQ